MRIHPMAMRLEPLCLLSALAMGTRHIGLRRYPASTTYSEPYHVCGARFASLDHLSSGAGRPGNVVTDFVRPARPRNLHTRPIIRITRLRYEMGG